MTRVGNYLEIKYDLKNSGTSPHVGFNGENYNVSSIRVYQPSLHKYDGQQVQQLSYLFFTMVRHIREEIQKNLVVSDSIPVGNRIFKLYNF